MKKIHRPDAYDRLVVQLNQQGKPISIEALVAIWARKNHAALVRIAFKMMKADDVMTRYVIPPFAFTAFTSAEERMHYHNALVVELERSGKPIEFKQLAMLHVTKFLRWVRTQVENQLAGIALEATYGSLDNAPTVEPVTTWS